MKTTKIHFLLEAQTPIAHHEGTFGNTAVHMRRKMRASDGGFMRIPIITADTMRHGMRSAASLATLDAAGLLSAPALTEPAMRLLFNGGVITGATGGSVKLGDYRELCELVPPLALFGGCAQNRIVPGRLQVSDAVLVCEETEHMMPEFVAEYLQGETQPSHREHMEEVQRVRMDSALDPAKRQLMSPAARDEAETKLLASENAADKGGAASLASKSLMMPRRFETIVRGSLFYWTCTATTFSDLDEDTFMVAVGAFLSHAVVGGKRGTGHGELRAVAAHRAPIISPADRMAEPMDVNALSTGRWGDIFRAHVSERADKIASFLDVVSA